MKKMFSLLLVLCLILNVVVSNVSASGDYGVVTTNEGEMYKDAHGNLHHIIVGPNGEKEVIISQYEAAPLEAILKRDAKETKEQSALSDEILRKYTSENFSITASSNYYITLSSIFTYNQRYKGWGDLILGFGPDSIKESGCFLTSCAMMLATYNLTLNGSVVSPLNLNTWLKNNGGFSGDLLIFGTLAKFPGINSVGYFDSFYDASIAINYHIVPILRMFPEHYSPLVKTNGIKDLDNNWIMNTYSSNYSYDYNNSGGLVASTSYISVPYFQTVTQSGYNFASSSIFRTAYPN